MQLANTGETIPYSVIVVANRKPTEKEKRAIGRCKSWREKPLRVTINNLATARKNASIRDAVAKLDRR
jgi:hypothetical protein